MFFELTPRTSINNNNNDNNKNSDESNKYYSDFKKWIAFKAKNLIRNY